LSKNILKANHNPIGSRHTSASLGFKIVKKHFESKSQHKKKNGDKDDAWF